MRGNTGILLIAVGLIALYIVLSDKYACFTQFAACLTGQDLYTPEGHVISDNNPAVPTISIPSNPSQIPGAVLDVYDMLKKVTGISLGNT